MRSMSRIYLEVFSVLLELLSVLMDLELLRAIYLGLFRFDSLWLLLEHHELIFGRRFQQLDFFGVAGRFGAIARKFFLV